MIIEDYIIYFLKINKKGLTNMFNKKKVPCLIFILFSFLFCNLLCTHTAFANQNLTKDWQYKEVLSFDAPKRKNSSESILKEINSDKLNATWKEHDLFINKSYPVPLEVTQLWMTNTIQYDSDKENYTLLFMTEDTALNIWIDDKKVYSFSDIMNPPKGKYWHRVNLPPLYKDAKITIQLSSNTRNKLGNFIYFKFGTTKEITKQLFAFGIPIMVSLPVCFIVILILAFYFFKQNSWQKLYLSSIVFLSNMALWMLLKSVMFSLYFVQNTTTYYLSFIAMILFPVSANHVGYIIIENNKKYIFKYLNRIWLSLGALAIIFNFVGLPGINVATNTFYAFLGITYPYIMYILYKSYKNGNRFSLGLLIPLVIIVFLGAFDGINIQGRLTSYYSYISPVGVYGTIFFLIIMIQSQLKKTMSTEKELINLEYKKVIAQYHLEHDTLTGCMNRTKFIEDIKKFVQQAEKKNVLLTYFLLDIDHFKNVNDKLGHKAGDEVLRSFAQVITKELGKDKFFYRWGGEEFIIICIDMTLEESEKFAEKLRKIIESTPINSVGKITTSIGISQWHRFEDSQEDLFKRADKAMYYAKENGRNRVITEKYKD